MEGVEPATCLVDAFGDEVSRKFGGFQLTAHIVNLGVGHGAAVEPHVDEVRLTAHGLAAVADQDDAVDIRAMEVEVFVVASVGIRGHETGLDGLLNLGAQLLHAAYALLFLAVLGAPDGQRGTPVAAAREVPVDDVLQPVAEAAAASGFGLPVDGLVEFYHAVLEGRGADEPAVEGVIEDGLVGTPAVRVAMRVLLALEEFALLLEHDDQLHVEAHILLTLGGIVGVLDELAGILAVFFNIHIGLHPFGVEVFDGGEAALLVDHGQLLAVAVEEQQVSDAGLLGHTGVVGTEGGCDMHDAGTVLGGHVVAQDDAEAAFIAHLGGLHPRNQRLVVQTFQCCTFALADNLVFGRLAFGEHRTHQSLGHDDAARLLGIRVRGLESHIVNIGANAKGGVRRQCPGRGRPCNGVGRHVLKVLSVLKVLNLKHSHTGGVLHVAVAARHIQLVARKTGAGGGAVGLDGVALVEQTLVIEFL